MSKKIILISDALSAPFDEGKKNIALSLHRQLESRGDNLSITITNAGNETGDLKVTKISLNKLFLNNKLRILLKKYSPDIIFYVPYSSCTFNAFLRTKILKLLCKKARVVILGAQQRKYSFVQKIILSNFLKPDLLLLLGRSDADFFLEKGINIMILPPAVDNAKFRPATEEEKQKIRVEYSILNDKTIVLHVGHINTNRNIECLLQIQGIDNIQVVIIGSTTTKAEINLRDRLVRAGVRVIDDFIQDISKIYKMSDVYVFPVHNNTAAIEMPLSVLEALACNLPVITTRFGGLVDYFKEDTGFRYFDTTEDLVELVKHMDKDVDKSEIHNNRKVEHFTWDRFANEIIGACDELV